ncbi:MAG: phosphoenolpyruvate--protein phosphotransferase [Defluviitaleaceae bacterium]|nr:phosphoenolpyruvate--protein phosphotransferase [Defluviitaleaceae bacterium]
MKYKGNPVSPGIAVGEVYRYTVFSPDIKAKTISLGEAEVALHQYLDIKEKAKRELLAIKEKYPDKADIFAAHIEMLSDIAMNEEIQERITEGLLSPEWAIQKTYDKFIRLLSKVKDPVMQERVADLQDIRRRLYRIWFGVKETNLSDLSHFKRPVVIVAHDLFPSDTATLDRPNVAAIVTEIGGSTSHSAIIARSYEIPAVLGVADIMANLKDDETIIVDALEGILLTRPTEEDQRVYSKKRKEYLVYAKDLKKFQGVEPVTKDGVRIDIHLNIGSAAPEELEGSKYTDGVGLFRTEFMYMSGTHLPSEEEQFKEYRKAALEFGERPLILRTLDIGGDKQLESMELPKEDNPFLGLRALRLCFANLPLFKTQLRAALRAACYGNLWIMLPMVGSIDDIRNAKAIIEEVKNELKQENIQYNDDVKIGIMIEIPAIALMAEVAAQEVDFASIGTNDLCQYLTAVDRLNPSVSSYYQSYHPAMFRIIGQVVSAFNTAGKPIGVCGEMGGDPHAAAILIGLGMRKLSMGISAVAGIKKLITGLTISQAEELAKKAVSLSTAEEVENLKKN